MPPRFSALFLLPVLLLLAGPAAADGPAAAPASETAAAAYESLVAALPVPSREQAFRFDGVLRIGGKRAGHVMLGSRPVGEGDARSWETIDQFVIKRGATPLVEISRATLDRRLTLVRGTFRSSDAKAAGIQWERTEKGFRATSKQGAVETQHVFPHGGTALATVAATVQFARAALAQAPAVYGGSIFNVRKGIKGGAAFQTMTLEVVGEQELDGHKVLFVRGAKGTQKIELLFRPADHELQAITFIEGAQRAQILKGDRWSLPARTAKQAAARAAFAFGTGSVEILDDVILWPAFYKSAVAKRSPDAKGEPPTLKDFRSQIVAKWARVLPKNPAAMIEQGLSMVAPQVVETKRSDGTVDVQYPATFRNLKFHVGQAYGYWHLIALPTQNAKAEAPKPPLPPVAPKKSD